VGERKGLGRPAQNANENEDEDVPGVSNSLKASFSKRFVGGPEIRLRDFELADSAGITVLFGSSGVGKTTVLRCLAGLEKPDEGTIRVDGRVWVDVQGGIFVPPRERRVGFVPQDYALFPHLDVESNIGYGLHGEPREERRRRGGEAIEWLKLGGLEKRLPRELSGGQQQRVALARAVVRRPCLLLLDEPFSAVDLPTRQRLRSEMRAVVSALNIPTVIVTHDRTDGLALGDRIAVMHAGEIVQQGKPSEVFSRPASVEVASVVAIETVQPGKVVGAGDLVTIAVGEARLTALGGELPTGTTEVYVCIRAEDVILMKGQPGQSSPRNALSALVRDVGQEGAMRRIDLDCGFPLMALLTKQACEELALAPGQRLLALIKAPHVHLIPR
jgi:molybdate transport system ATP-binding protein